MDITNIDFAQILQPIFFIKPILLVFLGFYLIFALIVFKQIKSLNGIVKAGTASSTLELIAVINLLAAVSLFLYSLVIL